MKFIATTRNAQGTSASRRLRRADKLPGIVYGANVPATAIELDHNTIFYALRKEKFHASILTMELDGKEELVLLRAFQMHPYKAQVLHIDFQRINANEKIIMRVPLHFVGGENSPAVIVDKGVISHTVSSVEVNCLPANLPEFITVDLSNLKADEVIHLFDIALPEGVEIHAKENITVVSVVAQTAEETEATAEEAPAAEATPAA